MASRLSVERGDLAQLWFVVARHADRNGDAELAKNARRQASHFRAKPIRNASDRHREEWRRRGY